MNIIRNHIKSKFSIVALNTVIFLFAFLFLILNAFEDIVFHRFQNQVFDDLSSVNNQSMRIEKVLNQLFSESISHPSDSSIWQLLNGIKENEDLDVFCYNSRDGNLVYWTTDQYLINLSENEQGSGILINNKGVFIINQAVARGLKVWVSKQVYSKAAITNQYLESSPTDTYKRFGSFQINTTGTGRPVFLPGYHNASFYFIPGNPFFYRQGLLLFLILATIFSFYIILGKASRPVLSGRHKLMTTEGIPMILMAVIAILSEFLMNQLGWFQPVYIITIGSYSASLVAFLVLVFLYVKILIFTISFVRENLLKQRRLLYSKNIPLLLFTLIGWGTIRIIMAASETFDLEFSSQLYLNLTCRHIVLFIIMGTMASMLVFFFDKCNISIILSSYLGNRKLVLCVVIITLSISYYFFPKAIFLALLLLCTLSLIQFIGKESIGRNWLLKNSLLLLITAAIMGGILFQAQQTRNEAKKKLYLHTVDIKESGDPITMSLFRDIVNQIHRDSIISQNYLANGKIEEAQTYIQERYFSGYWNQFMISTTLCYSGDSLQTDLNSRKICCMDYFRVLAEKSPNQFFDSPELKLVEYGQNLSGYIGIIPLGPTGPFAFIEMVPGNIIRTVGFSDVFRDQEIRNRIELGSYSFARYSKHHLVSHTGIITFPYHIPEFLKSEKKYFSIHHQGVHYNGLLSSGGSLYIIACENNYFTNYIALFSVIFIFSAISYLIIVFAIAHEQQSLLSLKLLAARFQITLVSIIVVSMILTGFYFLRAYGKFQQSRLESRVSEKTHSINLEFQHKVENFGPQWIINTQTTRAFAQKLGNIFFADIHLFNASGELISSTSPVLYEKGLSSGFIHPLAYQRILIERAPIFIQRETIGSFTYYSGYMPVKDFENRILGVISIPQISHTPDTEQEASQYIAAFISIYVLIVIVATAVALISTNRLVKPLFFLSASLAEFKIGTKNSKIPFSRTDEIGEMIALYNEMVDRLDLTILELKHKERDLAWRDIARQIAHEIKNPLTPIKLQMQFLLQVYNPTDPDWQERFRRFSDSLFQQIDNLNQLANSFSEFIRLPEIRLSPIELNEVIDDSLIILSEFSGKYVIENEIDNKIIVNGDKQQLVRLFVNLFKNAVQAIGENRQGLIHVDVTIENSKGVVRIRDNGSGIPPEMTDKVFLPNFTTKTSGMGIGLFIAKTIVAQHGGNIRFDSTPGEGTEFIVSLPLIQAKDS